MSDPSGPSRKPNTGNNSKWEERPVDRQQPHFVISHGPISDASPVALVGPEIDGKFGVEFLVPRDSEDEHVQSVVRDVLREIDYYLDELGEPHPWAYAIYHCSTMSNLIGRVHWSYYEPSD
jgi:hypothetical protein